MPPLRNNRPLRRRRALRRRARLQDAPTVPLPLVPASPAQRDKVRGATCLVCGRAPVDPAHLVPQRLGGCAHPDCVVPLCRAHHRAYDRDGFALGSHLRRSWSRERRHALSHASRAALRRALSGRGWSQ